MYQICHPKEASSLQCLSLPLLHVLIHHLIDEGAEVEQLAQSHVTYRYVEPR